MSPIRAATPADAAGVARVHVDSWRSTYRGLLPDDLLDSLNYQRRQEGWANMFSRADQREFAYVAEQPPQGIVGFVAGGPARTDLGPYPGEIYAIYLADSHQKLGIGRALFEQARTALAGRGYAGFMLWVLQGNPTQGFYEHMGGEQIGRKEESIGGQLVTELAYGWVKN